LFVVGLPLPVRSGRSVSAKYTFRITSEERSRDLPGKILIAQSPTESTADVVLKFLGYVLFYRERIQMETNLHMDFIPYTPDLVQLDYELRPRLWVECGECTPSKLNKLAVKVHDADIWILKRSPEEAEDLFRSMEKQKLRRDRYGIIGLDEAMFNELCELLTERNQLTWFKGTFDPPQLQFEFNTLWFDAPFTLLKF
jgi:uncharacterized protein YaeQ